MGTKEQILDALGKHARNGMDRLIFFLNSTDFFTAPASTKYHGAYVGGLAEHSWNVRNILTHKNKIYNLGLSQESIDIIGICHDLCKVGFYKLGKKSVKVGQKPDGKPIWEDQDVYEVDETYPLGHGEKSVILLQQFIQLNDDEIMAIRWHMGPWEDKDNKSLSSAFGKYPVAVAMHTADMEATYLIEGRKGEKDNGKAAATGNQGNEHV